MFYPNSTLLLEINGNRNDFVDVWNLVILEHCEALYTTYALVSNNLADPISSYLRENNYDTMVDYSGDISISKMLKFSQKFSDEFCILREI